jgi:pSer/pThr/pTyr-binding forkhead associated (FHA) protein
MDAPLPQAWLEHVDGRMQWLELGTCTIGRGTTNTIVLDFPGVSRSHAMLQPGPGGGYLIGDLRSTNGTYLNGLRLEQVAPLRDGDKIEIGTIALTYRCQQSASTMGDTGKTSVQIHTGPCWLLLLDVVGYTTHTQNVGNEAAAADFKHWLEQVRPILVRYSGTINAYLGDAIFIYWRQDKHDPGKVASAIKELAGYQTSSPLPFRMLAHHGRVHISGGLQGESLSSADVIFIFRIEKSTKSLGSPVVLSQPAVSTLPLGDAARLLGEHPVPDYEGKHAFYALRA